jgi:H+/Cl- antiporter ClcA
VIRWLRLIAIATVILSMIGLGLIVGLFLVANNGWIPVETPPWLVGLFGGKHREVWLPALIGGWLAAALLIAGFVLWSMFYVWRRRQYESLIGRLEKELAKLRNLPFTEPAPLEDLPETPSVHAARVMSALGDEDDDPPLLTERSSAG